MSNINSNKGIGGKIENKSVNICLQSGNRCLQNEDYKLFLPFFAKYLLYLC